MFDLQTILTYLTLISIPVGVAYHIMTLNNSRKNQQLQLETRQAQLLMNIANTFRSTEFRKQWHTLWKLEWKDRYDFREKYWDTPEIMAAFTSVLTFFESVGVIVRYKLISIDLVYSLLGGHILMAWDKYEDLVMGDREFFQRESGWDDMEYLYQEILKKDKELNR